MACSTASGSLRYGRVEFAGAGSTATAPEHVQAHAGLGDGFAGGNHDQRRDLGLRDVRDFANPAPRARPGSRALPAERDGYSGAFSRKEDRPGASTAFGPGPD